MPKRRQSFGVLLRLGCDKMKLARITVLVVVTRVGAACGPEISSDRDPEPIIAAFCENIFRCPETLAMLGYDSVDECEDIHREDYDIRDATCQHRVLLLEQCLSELMCEELGADQPCGDERDFLTEKCHGL